MNNVNLQQAGGFPLETDTLDFMQTAYKSLQSLAAIGGDNFVLKGCVKNGANVTDGFVVIAGEVLEFRGGLEQSHIIIRTEGSNRPFENGQVKEVFVVRYATFGNGIGAIEWSTIKRLKTLDTFKDLPHEASSSINLDDETKLATSKAIKLLNDKINALLPANIILIWSGAINAIPNGFALCDGQEGRPDLRDKFVLGAGLNYPVGAIGGEKEHRLTINEMPSHSHNFDPGDVNGKSDNANDRNVRVPGNENRQTNSVGGDMPHNNMPPYYAFAYIIKL